LDSAEKKQPFGRGGGVAFTITQTLEIISRIVAVEK